MAYEKYKEEQYNNIGGINDKASEYITGGSQFLDIRNYGFVRPGALVSRPGTADYASLPLASYLTVPKGLVQFRKFDGSSQIVFDSGDKLFALDNASSVATSLTPNVTTGYQIDYTIGDNVLYYANGYTFQRYDGSYSCWYNIPSQRVFAVGSQLTFSTSLTVQGSTVVLAPGYYQFKYALSKSRPSGASFILGITGERASDDLDVGINNPFLGVSLASTLVASQGGWIAFGFTVPFGYGVSSIVPYMKVDSGEYKGGPNYTQFFATTYSGITLYTVNFAHFTVATDYNNQFNFTLVPSMLESYSNMMFMAGFSSYPSRVYFSNIASFENLEAENFFDVRTGNNDDIKCLFVFQDNLIVFKNRSIHAVVGDSPETLALKDMTLEYGCVNNSSAVQFNNKLWFMDERGICEFNGPDTFIVSYAVEQKLAQVDKTKCRAFHIKKRNEVWFCCGGTCFVYDYDVNAWTIYDSVPIEFSKASEIIEYADGSRDLTYFNQHGSSFIELTRFNDSVYKDRGADITLMAKTRFHKRLGESTQELWRRTYVDVEAASLPITATLNFSQDYGTSIVLSRSVTLTGFQERIDHGVSAKALSIEFIIKAGQQVTFNGYTVESKYLRNV